MRITTPLCSVALVLSAVAGDGATTTMDVGHSRGATSHANAALACYDVSFTVTGTPTGTFTFEGTLTGDLEGTATIVFDPGSISFAGVTVANAGVASWAVTGGTVPGLTAFGTAFDNRNLLSDRPGSPATVFENIGKHRAVSGVTRANLAYTGVFTVADLQFVHEYHGVICP